MKKVAIIDIVRTPWGIPGGAMARLGSHDLAAAVLDALSRRNSIMPEELDHIIFGQARPSTFPSNVARYAALMLRWPENIPAYTVQSNCASGMQALRSAYYLIASGNADVVVAGGTDSFSSAPFVMRNVRYNFKESNRVIYDTITEGELWTQPIPMTYAAKQGALAAREGIPTDEQESYATGSRCHSVDAQGLMQKYITPVTIADRKHGDTTITDDEHTGQPPAIIAPYADGAAAVLLMSEDQVQQLGLYPMAWINGFAVSGCPPWRSDKGPLIAIQKLLSAKSMSVGDIDCLELFEDTSAGVIVARRSLDVQGLRAMVNVYGGALGTGKSEGGDGPIMLLSLALALKNNDKSLGIAAMSSSGGQGIAALLETAGNQENGKEQKL